MKDIIKELEKAIANLEVLSMSGKAVDVMAAAKCNIYRAQEMLQERINNEEVKNDGGSNHKEGQ